VSGFLLDTNVISELVKSRPEPAVVRWVDESDENLLYLSVLTLGEIRKGIVAWPQSARRVALEAWLESDLRLRFSKRILSIDEGVADRWGVLAEQAQKDGRGLPVIDGLLAATAIHYNLTLVTRNTSDLGSTGALLFNPWGS
jgi:predicted nucleic acid-binding protein